VPAASALRPVAVGKANRVTVCGQARRIRRIDGAGRATIGLATVWTVHPTGEMYAERTASIGGRRGRPGSALNGITAAQPANTADSKSMGPGPGVC